MPTTSSHYTDLEYATFNEDATTWGDITNEYLDGLLAKLKTLSDRINSAGVGSDSDLSQILRDISQYTNLNSSIPPAVKTLFGITDLKAADTYSYATDWNATYDSYLKGFGLDPPGSAAAVQSFDYDLLAEKLRPYLTQAQNNLKQANSDIEHVNAILYRLNVAGRVARVVYQAMGVESGVPGTVTISPAGTDYLGDREFVVFTPTDLTAYSTFATAFYNDRKADNPNTGYSSSSFQLSISSTEESNYTAAQYPTNGTKLTTIKDLSNTVNIIGRPPTGLTLAGVIRQAFNGQTNIEFYQNKTNVTSATQTFSVNWRFRTYRTGYYY